MTTEVAMGGFGVFLLIHTGLLIWHLSKITTTLGFIHNDLSRLGKDFEKHVEKDAEMFDTTWKKFDGLRAKVESLA